MDQWLEARRVCEPVAATQPVCNVGICFDPQQELLWSLLDSGYVTSYAVPNLEKYTSFRAHATGARQLLVDDHNVISLSGTEVRCTGRGGVYKWALDVPAQSEFGCMTHNHSSELVVATQDSILLVSIVRGKITQEFPVENGKSVFLMTRSSRFVCCGTTSGEVQLRDSRTMKIEHTLAAHTGTLSDIDASGNTLITCGFSQRSGNMVVDPLIKVYDLRMVRALAPIPFPMGPSLLRFHPKLSSTAVAVSHSGKFQICDMGTLSAIPAWYQPNLGSAVCTSLDLSSTGEIIAIGDSSGVVHTWSPSSVLERSMNGGDPPLVNAYSAQFELVAPPVPLGNGPVNMTENSPFSLIGVPFYSEPLLSQWPYRYTFDFNAQPQFIEPEVINKIKVADTIGYAPNPGTRLRNQAKDGWNGKSNKKKSRRNEDAPLFRSEKKNLQNLRNQSHSDHEDYADQPHQGNLHVEADDPQALVIPKRYQLVEIKYSRFGVEDFDFGYYNQSQFGGLETDIANSYCNSLLQTLFFIPAFRRLVIAHMSGSCDRELCISCELGFLFRMLEQSNGQNCQATNFLKAFGSIPQASALGLFEPTEPTSDTCYATLIQGFNRFILEQLHQELLSSFPANSFLENATADFPLCLESPVVLESDSPSTGGEGGDGTSREEKPKVVDGGKAKEDTGSDVSKTMLGNSTKSSTNKAASAHPTSHGPPAAPITHSPIQQLFGWKYRSVSRCQCGVETSREICSNVVHLYYPSKDKEREKEKEKEKNSKSADSKVEKPEIDGGASARKETFASILKASILRETTNKAWCETHHKYLPSTQKRYLLSLPPVLAINCNAYKEELDIWHEADGTHDRTDAGLEDDPSLAFVPPIMLISVEASDFQVDLVPRREALDRLAGFKSNGSKIMQAYELTSCVSEIKPDKGRSHLVSHVQAYQGKATDPHPSSKSWYLFNDFMVTASSLADALNFRPKWKRPSILYYTAINIADALQTSRLKVHFDTAVLTRDFSLARRKKNAVKTNSTVVPLGPDEIPTKGTLCAIDAEFVALNQEEMEIRSDGTKFLLKPSRMHLARVTVVRGQGPLEGVPFIDDYVTTNEPVVNYLTEFSGIKAGDLDPASSPYNLVSLKVAYRKLRLLLDLGCIFVGHGLNTDFRTINILVPPEQVIDTVELFKGPGQRKISLRFLAWFLLNQEIQSETHCSIEDSKTALAIYKKYLQATEESQFEKTIQDLYSVGRQFSWKPPFNPKKTERDYPAIVSTSIGLNASSS